MDLHQKLTNESVVAGLVGTVGAILTYKLYKSISQPSEGNMPPIAPGRQPLFGHLLRMNQPIPPQKVFSKWAKEVGPVYTVHMGTKRWIILNNAESVRDLIVNRGAIYSSRELSSLLVDILFHGVENGGGLPFFPYGKEWRYLRRLTHGSLLKRKIDSYQHILDDRRLDFLKNLEAACKDGQEFCMNTQIEHLAMTTVLSIVYGGELCYYDTNNPDLHAIYAQTAESTAVLQPSEQIREFLPIFSYIIPSRTKQYQGLVKRTDTFHGNLLRQFKEKMAKNPDDVEDCFMKDLITENDEITDLRLSDLAMVFVAAGSDTTSGTLQWLVAALANHPEVQDKAYAEILQHVGKDRLPGPEDEDNLPYVKGILFETLRLHPPAPLSVPHCTTEDDVYGEWVIPKGTTVVMNLDSIHRDPTRYPQPDKFMPERHFEFIKNSNGQTSQAVEDRPHLSFSSGRRMCVGIHLAERSLFITATGLLSTYRIERVSEELIDVSRQRDIYGVTSNPIPHNIRLVRRVPIA
ncbi:cytochrome P450 [Phycomyces nitens]|nr:cytochrome P450 [Phycomyces nitens]